MMFLCITKIHQATGPARPARGAVAGGNVLVCRHIRVKLTKPLTGNLS